MVSPAFDEGLGFAEIIEDFSGQKFISEFGVEALTVVCIPKSGPVFELVPASDMELRHGQEINA